MIKLKRFHRDVYFPEWADDSITEFVESLSGCNLILSYHANGKYRNFSRQYRKAIKTLIQTVNLSESKSTIFEFYANKDNVVKKACFRFTTETESDIILVISSTGKIVTIFLNKNFDPHLSLDKSIYEQGEMNNERNQSQEG